MSLYDLILSIEPSVFQIQGKLALLHVYGEIEKEFKERIQELTELDIGGGTASEPHSGHRKRRLIFLLSLIR